MKGAKGGWKGKKKHEGREGSQEEERFYARELLISYRREWFVTVWRRSWIYQRRENRETVG